MDPSRRGVTTTSLAPVSFLASTTVDLARIQFATTSLYHFLFVPLTLGLAPFVAVMQTLWHRTGEVAWLRLTRFFGTLMLINFAIGVATGLVQEFQFGMNWSVYSKYVGDVFGAPLAIEGLAAFFLESTFLGLWIFGWNRLSPRLPKDPIAGSGGADRVGGEDVAGLDPIFQVRLRVLAAVVVDDQQLGIFEVVVETQRLQGEVDPVEVVVRCHPDGQRDHSHDTYLLC